MTRILLGTVEGVRLSPEGLVVPAGLRAGLEKELVMTKGLDGCVAVFPLSVWEGLMERMERISFLKGAARVFQRHTYGGASLDSLSPEGRMKVPDHLRRYAQLGDEVVLVGLATRLEVWNPDRWREEEAALKERAEQVSETLGEYGI